MSGISEKNDVQEFLRQLLSAVTSSALYGMQHQQVERLVMAAGTSPEHALTTQQGISLMAIDGELLINNMPQPFSLVLNRFAQFMQGIGISHIRFVSGITGQELKQFIIALCRFRETGARLEPTEHIKLGTVELQSEGGSDKEKGDSAPIPVSKTQISIKDLPAFELDRLAEVYEAIKNKERLKPSGIAATVSELVSAFDREGDTLIMMAAMRENDEYTFTHATNVSVLTIAQASAIGISGAELHEAGMAAMLHDVGKMFVPEEVLKKPDKLTDDEFEQMKIHPSKGARYLLESPGIPRLAPIVAYEHHMRFDLSGYPKTPAGWKPNIISQMTAISDCFDAMRTRRPYSEPRTPQEIFNFMLSRSGNDFHPLLLRNFLSVMTKIL
jgi:HD-GYP domain-containing protein (c-di-GMP phosphodiesterase class II)